MPSRSAAILFAWRVWRATRLMRASSAACDAGRLDQARALLDRADVVLRALDAGRQDQRHA